MNPEEAVSVTVIVKVHEDDRCVRYRFSVANKNERFLVLDKDANRVWPEDGVEDFPYGAAARQIAVMWGRERVVRGRIVVGHGGRVAA